MTAGYNAVINQRQFKAPGLRWPTEYRMPDETYSRHARRSTVGGEAFELLPRPRRDRRRDVGVGAGAQGAVRGRHVHLGVAELRQPAEGAALRARLGDRVPQDGRARTRGAAARSRAADRRRGPRATARSPKARSCSSRCVEQTLALMNEGARLDDIVQAVRAPEHLLERPYLHAGLRRARVRRAQHLALLRRLVRRRPVAPEARARRPRSPRELADLAGGAGAARGARASRSRPTGDLRLAGHLAELAAQAAPDDAGVHAARAEVFGARAARGGVDDVEGHLLVGRARVEPSRTGTTRETSVKIEGANILVTGASSGIGAALAPILAERGATVGIVARRADRLEEVLEQCRTFTPGLADVGRRPRRPRTGRAGRARGVGRVRRARRAREQRRDPEAHPRHRPHARTTCSTSWTSTSTPPSAWASRCCRA